MPILVVGAHRAFDVKSDGKSAEVLTDLAYVSHRIPLRGLDDEELRELLSDITDAPPPDAFVLEVQRATEGNPLFARELTHLALRERRIDRERFIPGRLPIPDTVREVIRRRLRPLSPGVRDLLILAAHVGRDFGVHVLSTVCGVPTNECLDRLVEAVRLQILVQTPESPRHYRFAHGLFGEVLRAEPSPTTKIQLHRRIGEAIETLRADNLEPFLEELAHHFWEAAQLSLESTHKAVEYGKRAGDQAVGLLAYEEGAIHYRRALEVLEECGPPVTQSRGDLYLALGKAEWWSGRREAARWALGRAAESARRLGNPTLLADAALGLGNVGYVPGRLDKELTDVLEEALVLLPPGDSTLRVRLLSRLASELVWDPESARRRDTLSLESVATARRLGDQAILAYSLKERHALMWSPEYLEERMSLVREAMAVARDAANREEELGALGLLCSELLERGGLRAADRHMRRFSLVAQDSRQAFFVWTAKVHTVLRALSEGRLGQVLPLADEALEFGERFVEPNARQIHGIHALIVARETGSLESLIVETERFVTENPGIPAWQAALAWVYAHAGRFEEARREFDELALDDFRGIPLDPFWLSALGPLSEVCALLGDVPRAAILYELLLPYADRHIIVAYFAASLGSVSMYLGILAGTRLRFEDAARHFNVALTAHESESPIWAARTRYHFASTILQDPAGDRNLALHLLDGAIGIANEIGMIGLLERANRLRVDAR
jgi:tetratricopeptide (TPR) repeat protein